QRGTQGVEAGREAADGRLLREGDRGADGANLLRTDLRPRDPRRDPQRRALRGDPGYPPPGVERGRDMMDGIFQDRQEAGQRLARALVERGYRGEGLLVLGIPRGGVVVAAEVARALHAPLDVVIARKLRAPYQPELAIGAVVSGDHLVIVDEALARA